MASDAPDDALLAELRALRTEVAEPTPQAIARVRAAADQRAARRRPARRLARSTGRFVAGALAGVVAVGGVAFAAQDAGPGGTLYSVKLAAESVRGWLALSPTGDAEYHLWRAEERLEELAGAAEAGDVAGALAAAERGEGELASASAILASIEGEAAASLRERAAGMAAQFDRLRDGLVAVEDVA